MGSFIISYLMGLLLVIGGSRQRGDLLDALATDTYWQLKGITPDVALLERTAQPEQVKDISTQVKDLQSDDFSTREKARAELNAMGPGILPQLKTAAKSADPEVAATAGGLVKKYTQFGQERAVRRLMAIRTLGERKEKDAVALLESMKDDKELFVAQYARQALAQIKGEAVAIPDLTSRMASDLSLLPADTAMVFQSTGINPDKLTVAHLVEKMMAQEAAERAMIAAAGGGQVAEAHDAKAMIKETSNQLLQVIDTIGNVRMDGITLALNVQGEDSGWYEVIIRGQYNAPAMLAAIKGMGGDAVKVEQAGDSLWPLTGIPMIRPAPEAAILFPDNEKVVILVSPKADADEPMKGMLAALKTGKGTFGENKELLAMLKYVDQKSPVWGAGKLSKFMQVDFLENVLSLSLQSKPTAEGADFTITALAEDGQKMKVVAEKLDAILKSTLAEGRKAVESEPFVKPAVEFLESMKVAADGSTGKLTGSMKISLIDIMLAELGPSLISEIMPQRQVQRVQMQAAPANPQSMPVAPPPADIP